MSCARNNKIRVSGNRSAGRPAITPHPVPYKKIDLSTNKTRGRVINTYGVVLVGEAHVAVGSVRMTVARQTRLGVVRSHVRGPVPADFADLAVRAGRVFL